MLVPLTHPSFLRPSSRSGAGEQSLQPGGVTAGTELKTIPIRCTFRGVCAVASIEARPNPTAASVAAASKAGRRSIDDTIRLRQHRGGYRQPDRPGRPEVDRELDFRRLLDRHLRRLCTPQYPIDVVYSAPVVGGLVVVVCDG